MAKACRNIKNQINIFLVHIENYNGTILKPQGDGFMVEFSSVVDAVRCATQIQKEISIISVETCRVF